MKRCPDCNGTGIDRRYLRCSSVCEKCDGVGWRDVPVGPASAPPGSPVKVAVMAARYRAGLLIFHPFDARPA